VSVPCNCRYHLLLASLLNS